MIGTTRFIDSEAIPILYPGECASSLSWEHTEDGRIVVTRWAVEPMPGLRGRWLRLRWRLFGERPRP